MNKLKKLAITQYLRAAKIRSSKVDEGVVISYEDIRAIHGYLQFYSGLLQNTPLFDTANPIDSGIDGTSIVLNKQVLSGSLYNTSESRPKTIEELILEIQAALDVSISEGSIASDLIGIKNAIGINKFDNSVESSTTSVDGELDTLRLELRQIAADCFNRGQGIGVEVNDASYSLVGDGAQTQQSSLIDKINLLLDAHGGIHNVNHASVVDEMVWSSNFDFAEEVPGQETVYTAPFNGKYEYIGQASIFYNPLGHPVRLKRLFCSIRENTLVDNLTVTVFVDGMPTEVELHAAGGYVGQVHYDDSEIIIYPGSFIQFRVDAGSANTGSIKLNNISIVMQRIINEVNS